MKLQDHMAEVIYREILRCPEKFPAELSSLAKKCHEIWGSLILFDSSHIGSSYIGSSYIGQMFLESLERESGNIYTDLYKTEGDTWLS